MGNLAFGKYKLIAELGHGGMADVFLAVQAGPAGMGFRKLTVVKRLRQNLADEPEFISMLVDEARIAARLNHPNVVQTNEVGSVGNQYFLAMEYLDGQPLHRIQHRSAQRSKAGDPVPLTAELQYLVLMDALAGLHHAHELQDYDGTPLSIVHRDMTPQNIFLTYEGQTKVVDFGIAKAAGRSSETRQGVVKGKVRYMAPEQALGLHVSRRTDVFAVGIMMWEAAVGKRMWRDYEEIEIVRALVSGELPKMPREIDPTIPEEVDAIIRKALALKIDERYATAEDFRLDIEQYLANTGQLVQIRRRLSPMLNTLFQDKRVEIRAIIEQQLATIEDEPSSGVAIMPQDSGSTSLLSLRPTPIAPAVTMLPRDSFAPSPPSSTLTSNGVSVVSTLMMPARPSSRFRAAKLGAATAIVIVLLAVGVWRTTASSASSGSSRGETADAGFVSVELSVAPATARLSIDDRPFESGPLALHIAPDDRVHHVRVEADGYESHTESVSFAHDLRTTITLSKASLDPAATAQATSSKVIVAAPPRQA